MTVEGVKHIVICSRRTIAVDEELAYDYKVGGGADELDGGNDLPCVGPTVPQKPHVGSQ